jgi:hypothetical protein
MFFKLPPPYNWNIVESGVKHHKPTCYQITGRTDLAIQDENTSELFSLKSLFFSYNFFRSYSAGCFK